MEDETCCGDHKNEVAKALSLFILCEKKNVIHIPVSETQGLNTCRGLSCPLRFHQLCTDALMTATTWM